MEAAYQPLLFTSHHGPVRNLNLTGGPARKLSKVIENKSGSKLRMADDRATDFVSEYSSYDVPVESDCMSAMLQYNAV